jgi:hypothetical protein
MDVHDPAVRGIEHQMEMARLNLEGASAFVAHDAL